MGSVGVYLYLGLQMSEQESGEGIGQAMEAPRFLRFIQRGRLRRVRQWKLKVLRKGKKRKMCLSLKIVHAVSFQEQRPK